MTIKLRETWDYEFITELLKDDELWPRISEDGIHKSAWEAPQDSVHYLLCMSEDGTAGLFVVHPLNATALEVHINILQQFRQRHAYDCGKAFVEWFVNRAPENFHKVIAQVPVIYPEVAKFTQKFGFLDEGLNRKSIMKQGELIDQHYYGLTRSDAVDWFMLHGQD